MTTCVNYWTYSHETIRHEMYDGHGPSSQSDAMLGWHQLAERLSSVRRYVDTAIAGVQASQRGAAADAAVVAMTPLGAWVEEARRLAIETGNKIDDQISAFTAAKGNVPEVPPEPRGWGWKDIPGIDSFTTSDQEIDEAFNREQESQARAAMSLYQNGTNTRLMNLTQFAPPLAGEPNLIIPTGDRVGIGEFLGTGAPAGNDGSGALPGSPTTLAGPASSASTGPIAAAPTPTSLQSGTGIGNPDYAGVRPATGTPQASGGFLSATPVVATPVDGALSRSGRGVTRGGSAAGGFGFPRGRVPAGLGSHRAIGGFGPTGLPESVAARGPSASAAGTSRLPGTGTGIGTGASGATGAAAPIGAMGGSRGDEDKERRRPSYLVESDSDRLIGDLPRTAPAVIGEDPSDDREPHRR
ncbi:MAG: PPE domain-containing protein [Pseudonocardiaceae bacterium]